MSGRAGFSPLDALWLVAAPLAGHAFFTALMVSEADSSAEILLINAIGAAMLAVILTRRRYGPFAVIAACALPGAAFAYFRVYWTMGTYSPGGAAQQLTSTELPGWAAWGAVLALVSAAGWGLGRFDIAYEKKTGSSMFAGDDE